MKEKILKMVQSCNKNHRTKIWRQVLELKFKRKRHGTQQDGLARYQKTSGRDKQQERNLKISRKKEENGDFWSINVYKRELMVKEEDDYGDCTMWSQEGYYTHNSV